MRQLSIEDFRRPLKVETVTLDPSPNDEPGHGDSNSIDGEILQSNDPLALAPPPDVPSVRIPLALKSVIGAPITSRVELICALTSGLPKNEYNLPLVIYRPDVLDWQIFKDITDDKFETLQAFLTAATIPISYHEGYPALADGEPLWAKFDYESLEDYALFEQYLHLPGARQVNLLTGTALRRAADLFHTNYWGVRAQAHDAFVIAHHQRLREQRILSHDDKAYLEAEKLIIRLQGMHNDVDWKALAMDPEAYVKTLERVIEIQRKALNIAGQGNRKDENTGQTTELIMRRITKGDRTVEGEKDANAEDFDLRALLNATPDVAQLQELVLRVGHLKKT